MTVAGTATAAIFHAPGSPFEFLELPIPSPGPGEILVRITCASICGSDLHTWHGRRSEPTPCVLGHEIVGRIVGFGDGAPQADLTGAPLREGDRITWTVAASCGECFFCRRGLPQKCVELFKYGHTALAPGREWSGGFADFCVLRPGTGIVRIPGELADGFVAATNCAVATVAAALRTAGPITGATVAVIGTGVLGLNACAMARHLGAAKVLACDLDPHRETEALAFGATCFVTPSRLGDAARAISSGRGADLALEFSGSSQGVVNAIGAIRTGGAAIIAGTASPTDPVPLDPQDLLRRMLRIEGVHNYTPADLVSAVSFLAATHTRFPFHQLLGTTHPLTKLDAAFASASAGQRSLIIPGGPGDDFGS